MNKTQRLAHIRQLLESGAVTSQADLSRMLSMEGITVNQSTLSRDLKFLGVSKTSDRDGRSVYVLDSRPDISGADTRHPISTSQLRMAGFSSEIAVVHTQPGYAAAVSAQIDSGRLPEILGTLAGDDTIFIALREGTQKEQFRQNLRKVFPFMEMAE